MCAHFLLILESYSCFESIRADSRLQLRRDNVEISSLFDLTTPVALAIRWNFLSIFNRSKIIQLGSLAGNYPFGGILRVGVFTIHNFCHHGITKRYTFLHQTAFKTCIHHARPVQSEGVPVRIQKKVKKRLEKSHKCHISCTTFT